MITKDEVSRKSDELKTTIQEAKDLKRTKAQDLALVFAQRIASVSRTIFLLTDADAFIEAHAICRLLLEHFFNFSALLHVEKHYDLLLEHSKGEPSRQFRNIIEEDANNAVLTHENSHRIKEYLHHPNRKKESKTLLNWEQIAHSAETAGLYTTYKHYSYFYAHSTLASILKEVSEKDIAQLHENVKTILELSRLILRTKLINVAIKTNK